MQTINDQKLFFFTQLDFLASCLFGKCNGKPLLEVLTTTEDLGQKEI